MILLIDNYDSFSYNLYQLIGSMRPDIQVIRNDEWTIEEIRSFRPDSIILSPGPGKPSDAGICIRTVKEFGREIPILGVCLGHQSICEAFGGTVSYARQLMHGKMSVVSIDTKTPIFQGMPEKIEAARYHSLAVLPETLPDTLQVTARTEDGEIMAVQHRDYPIYGLQFHPESVLTPKGNLILKNFFFAL